MTITELEQAEGICINWQWKWILDGQSVTRQVNQAIKQGKLKAMYFARGKAGLSISMAKEVQ